MTAFVKPEIEYSREPSVMYSLRIKKKLKEQLDAEAQKLDISTADVVRQKLKRPLAFGSGL